MHQVKLKILSNTQLTEDIFRMWLSAENPNAFMAIQQTKAGQFMNIAIKGCYLRRPISICDIDDNKICIVYKVVGKGTAVMSAMQAGELLDVLLPLGNGFDLTPAGETPLLIGGGVGVPPMLMLAKRLLEQTEKVNVILGFNTKKDIILVNEFKQAGCNVTVTTADGSEGKKGFVTDAMSDIQHISYYYACGPVPMLRALAGRLTAEGQLSMEERMGCGFGLCMGCTCQTHEGAKQICTDGPVFRSTDIII